MDQLILELFFKFVKKYSLTIDCLGQCKLLCNQFIMHMCSCNNGDLDIKVSNEYILTLQNRIDGSKSEIKMVETLTIFKSYENFCRHTSRLHSSYDKIVDCSSTMNVHLKSTKGQQFNYYKKGVFTNSHTTAFGVGFPHFVLLVTSADTQYILDPSIKQFDDLLLALVVIE